MEKGVNLVKVVVNNGQYKLTIPKELALAKGWTSSTRLRFAEDLNGQVFLVEIKNKALKRTKDKIRGGRR